MKKLILALFILGTVTGAGLYLNAQTDTEDDDTELGSSLYQEPEDELQQEPEDQ